MSIPITSSSSLDEGCRILTISASLSGSTSFIERIKALSESGSDSTDTKHHLHSSDNGVTIAHYTISNRYYTAPVHFAAYELPTVYPGLFSLDPPALIYVWADGEPYVKQVEELSRIMAQGGYDPEVRLAVRIPAISSENRTNVEEPPTGDEEDTDIDSTLMSFGFEYVDATREATSAKTRGSDTAHDDIPSLPRVLDALSTVMWPSMQSSKKPTTTARPLPGSSAPSFRRDLEHNSIMEELLSVSGISGISRADVRPSLAQGDSYRSDDEEDADSLFSPYEFNSIAHLSGSSTAAFTSAPKPWLSEIDSNVSQTPCIVIPRSSRNSGVDANIATSPQEIDVSAPFEVDTSGFRQSETGVRPASIGFEDDFTVFVSAPAESESNKGGFRGWEPLDLSHAGFEAVDGQETQMATAFADSVVTGDSLDDSKGLMPASAAIGKGRMGNLYRSLGSVSDFGADETDKNVYTALGEENQSEDEDAGEEWEDNAEERGEAIESWEEYTEEWEDAHDLGEDEDEDMPTRQEILVTAARIFGGIPGGTLPTPAAGFTKASELAKDLPTTTSKIPPTSPTEKQDAGIASRSSVLTHDIQKTQGDEHAVHADPDPDELDDGIGPAGSIDIERVLHSLQGLREEIAGVDDEEERRRMAARVALGFVYGMDLDKMSLGSRGQE